MHPALTPTLSYVQATSSKRPMILSMQSIRFATTIAAASKSGMMIKLLTLLMLSTKP